MLIYAEQRLGFPRHLHSLWWCLGHDITAPVTGLEPAWQKSTSLTTAVRSIPRGGPLNDGSASTPQKIWFVWLKKTLSTASLRWTCRNWCSRREGGPNIPRHPHSGPHSPPSLFFPRNTDGLGLDTQTVVGLYPAAPSPPPNPPFPLTPSSTHSAPSLRGHKTSAHHSAEAPSSSTLGLASFAPPREELWHRRQGVLCDPFWWEESLLPGPYFCWQTTSPCPGGSAKAGLLQDGGCLQVLAPLWLRWSSLSLGYIASRLFSMHFHIPKKRFVYRSVACLSFPWAAPLSMGTLSAPPVEGTVGDQRAGARKKPPSTSYSISSRACDPHGTGPPPSAPREALILKVCLLSSSL